MADHVRKDAEKKLMKAGFYLNKGRGKGSHRCFESKDGRISVMIPQHSRDIGKGLYNKILKEAGIK